MYYHINDIIFLVRFPQFVGSLRRDVWTTAYWRDRPTRSTRHPYRLGLLRYRSAYRLLSYVTSFFRRFVLAPRWKRAINELTWSRVNDVVQSANLPLIVIRKGENVISSRAQTKSRLVFDLIAICNYASSPGTHAPQTGPAKRSGAGTFQLLEGITTSVHHLLYLFSAHDHYDHRRGKD